MASHRHGSDVPEWRGRMRGIGREWIVGPALVALMGAGVLFF